MLLKRGAASREAVTGISLSYASLPPGVLTHSQCNLLSLEGVRVSVCMRVYLRVYVCPGPTYAALIKPTAKRKTRPAASSNDPEYTYGCFGENKWAENGIHKHSWYREGRGGETLDSSTDAASQTIQLSHGEKRYFYRFCVILCQLLCISVCSCVILPANHLRVIVDRDVGSDAAVVGTKVAVWGTEPFIKAILQRKVLWSVAKMPVVRNKVLSHTVRPMKLTSHTKV